MFGLFEKEPTVQEKCAHQFEPVSYEVGPKYDIKPINDEDRYRVEEFMWAKMECENCGMRPRTVNRVDCRQGTIDEQDIEWEEE